MTTLNADVHDLLAAISDALNLPLPSNDPADERACERLTSLRSARARIVAQSVLDGSDLPNATDHLRRWTAETPITYTPWTPAEKGTSDADQAAAGESTQPHAPRPVNMAAAVSDPGIRGGEPCIPGTRVPAADVSGLLTAGMTAADIHALYPSVTAAAAERLKDAAPTGKDTGDSDQLPTGESTQDADEAVRITTSPSDPDTVILHLPEFSYMDTVVWSIEVGIPRAHLPALRAAIEETERRP